jgi:hypothetical protein
MNDSLKTALVKFAVDLATAGVAGASGVLAVTNLDATSPKVLAIAIGIGFLNGIINAARRYTLTQRAAQ